MGAPRRRPLHSVIALLRKEPHKFRFFQAVRLLQTKPRGTARTARLRTHEVGYHRDPRDERLRFVGNASLKFPSCEILKITPAVAEDENEPDPNQLADRYQMQVNFLGLYGTTGVMPQFDTQRLINVGRRANVEKAFLDLFNHRAISLFYRIWEKHRFYIGYERNEREENRGPDPFTERLQAIFGLGIPTVQNRLALRDEAFLYYAGQFGRGTRSAISLERMLNDFFSFPVEVIQFVGQWLTLDATNQSQMPTESQPLGVNCSLGSTFILGDRVWSRDGKFRLRLGPLSYEDFDRILTQGTEILALSQFTRMYVGMQYDFDVQLVLAKESVPEMQMSGSSDLRLGSNTWLITRKPDNDVDDCKIEVDGHPLNI
jgi:type VI secretion system protein ImpH